MAEQPSNTVHKLAIYLLKIMYNITEAIFIYSNIKTYVINSNNQNDHVRVSISSSSMYKVHVYDESNIHVKSFYLHHMRSYQMSRGTVERPSLPSLGNNR